MGGARSTVHLASAVIALILVLWLAALPTALAQVVACPTASGWTRLVAGRDARSSTEPAPPWEAFPLLNNGGPTEWLYSLAAGWEAPGVLYAGGQNGLFRSDDCGGTWTIRWQPSPPSPIEPTPIISLQKLAISASGRIYAGSSLSLHISNNAGVSLQPSERIPQQIGLGTSPANPDTAYVFGWYSGYTGSHDATRTVLRTTDGGRTWTQRTRARPQGAAMVDANDASVVYVFGDGVISRSVDGALTFEPYSEFDWLGGPGDPNLRRTPIRHAVTSADGSRWWLAVEDGEFMRSADLGLSWKRVPPLPDVTGQTRVSRAMTASPHDPGTFFVLFGGDEVWMYRESPGAQARAMSITDE